MKYLSALWALSFFLFSSFNISAQTSCADGETEVIIEIISDGYPNEISWDISLGGELIASGDGGVGDTLCVSSAAEFPCYLFEIHDSYGDGIFSPGGYWLYLDGEEIASGGDYDYGDVVAFDCAPGTTCNDAVDLGMPSEEGDVIAQEGSPKELYNFPKNKFVANFIGDANDISAEIINKQSIRYSPIETDTFCFFNQEKL